MYAINSKMIFEILNFRKFNYPEDNMVYVGEDIYNSNYTTIIKSNLPELKKYIDNNIKEYVENVFLKLESNNNEDEGTIIKLLENTNSILDITLKSEIIKKQNNKISNIKDVSEDLWVELIENNKLKPSWKNILCYFEKSEQIDELEDYLNIEENYIELSKSEIVEGEEKFGTEMISDFIKELINSNISNESFAYLKNCINQTYDNIGTLEVVNLVRISDLI